MTFCGAARNLIVVMRLSSFTQPTKNWCLKTALKKEPMKPLLTSLLSSTDETQFFIKHSGGLCISKHQSTDQLQFTSTCYEKFTYTPDQTLKHIQSRKCIRPDIPNGGNKIMMLTSDCDDVNAVFVHTSRFSLQQNTTGMCIHPRGGFARPPPGNVMVIHSGCDQTRLRFDFI